jgi:hypothetical protein
MQGCKRCGIAFDYDLVQSNPFKRCPNPACSAPLDADAVAHTFVEASNPSDVKDAQRLMNRAQLTADATAAVAEAVAAGSVSATDAMVPRAQLEAVRAAREAAKPTSPALTPA